MKAFGIRARTLAETILAPEPGSRSGGALLRSTAERIEPADETVQQLFHDLAVVAARSRKHVKRMVRAFDLFQCRERSQSRDDRLQKPEIRELVSRSLQEQHRHGDLREVCGSRR